MSDYVNIGNVLNFNATSSLTVSAWFMALGNNADSRIIAKQGNFSLGDPGYQISILNNDIHGVISAGLGTEQIALFSGENINDNKWHHIALVRDNGNTIKLFFDGFETNSEVDLITGDLTNNRSLTIASEINGSQVFNGQIDEVRIWNVARTQAQIRDDMCRQLTGTETGLVGYWNMNEGADNTCAGGEDVCDQSGNGNHGTKF